MSVIAEITVAANEFELGRILELEGGEYLELETMVPLGQKAVPFFRVHDQVRETFEELVENHPSVDRVREVDTHADERLFTLDWDTSSDHFFNAVTTTGAQLLTAHGSVTEWQIELRFPSHDALSQFHDLCENARIDFEVERVYNPTKPTIGPWYGLTEQQRETLMRAVEGGYYSIPRQLSTQDLAEEFDISDQAITERLRRAIVMLTENTLLSMPDTNEDDE
jgi:predicted DNA binding protein